jgi:hypothetical protein
MRAPQALALAALLALAGCGDENRTQVEATPSIERIATSANDTTAPPAPAAEAPLPVPPVPASAPPPLPLAFAPAGEGGVSGSGTLKATGGATEYSARLRGVPAGATFSGAVRAGSCARVGPTIAWLVPASAGPEGTGSASGDIPVPLDSLVRTPHVVVYGPGGRPATCAPVPSRPPMPVDTTAS